MGYFLIVLGLYWIGVLAHHAITGYQFNRFTNIFAYAFVALTLIGDGLALIGGV